MFGSRKNRNVSEQSKEYLTQILDKQEVFEANLSQIEAVEKQLKEDIAQVEENTCTVVDHATLNVETETIILHFLDELKEEQAKVYSDYVGLCEGIQKQMDAAVGLVEQNKHYTSPAKFLSEVPAELREKNKSYEKHLGEMAEYGKKMSALARNAAVEAEKLGDSGKMFVSVAEEIRQNALNYEKTALALRNEFAESHKELKELENTIHHIVSLLKDTNMGAAKLLKKCQHNNRQMESLNMRDFSEDLEEIRDKVVGLRNQDEEIVKSGERNKLQLTDIKEEVQSVEKDLCEIDSDISYLMDLTAEQM